MVYLKHYAHLFVEDGQEGEVVPTFHISKTTDLDSASDPIPIPHCYAPLIFDKTGAYNNNLWRDTLADSGGIHRTYHRQTPAVGTDRP
jgi:hypothetical protein